MTKATYQIAGLGTILLAILSPLMMEGDASFSILLIAIGAAILKGK